MRRLALTVLLSSATALLLSTTAQAQNYITVFSPSYYDSADLDEAVRFSWLAHNSQDYFRVAFSEYPTFGSFYWTSETVLSSISMTPREMGMGPGTWYWRVCYRWWDTSGYGCYLDDEVRTLRVTQPASPLPIAPTPRPVPVPVPGSPALGPPQPQSTPQSQPGVLLTDPEARRIASRALRRRFQRRLVRLYCKRKSNSVMVCRGYFRKQGSRLAVVQETPTEYLVRFV